MNMSLIVNTRRLLPGLSLCVLVTALSFGLEHLEFILFGRAWLESLVLAILLGSLLRTFYSFHARYEAGVQFGAKMLLEIAVVLLGASVSASAIMEKGPYLLFGIAGLVVLAITVSYGIGRFFGLPQKMAILIACGNSICGNSAIAAVAPVIDADGNDVAASIAFTAVLGIVVVLILPLMVSLLSLSVLQYGVFAGLTVYAVPQVIAATGSVSLISVHIGTLVKLIRVLMLGPVILTISLFSRKEGSQRPPLTQLLPWFIIGFLVLMVLRSFNFVPQFAIQAVHEVANVLTIMSMAALGLGVNMRSVASAGGRVAAVVVLSLLGLFVISYGLFMLLRIA